MSQSRRDVRTRIMSTEQILLLAICAVSCTIATAPVPTVRLSDGRHMPAIALGTWLGNSSSGFIKPNANEVELAVKWALEVGYRHIDTAWVYAIEDQVGRAVKGMNRDEVFITTKLWNDKHARDAVVPTLRESLHNLQLDYVDLYLIHFPIGQFSNLTYDYTDYTETWQGMIDAKKLGLTKSIGLSNFNPYQMQRIFDLGLEKPAVLQVEINLNLQQPELLAFCKSHNITVEGYTPFGSLFYSKADADVPPPRMNDPILVEIAKKYKKTVPQIVLRYLVELGVVPLPKSITKIRIQQNVEIFDFKLTDDEKDKLKSFDRKYRSIPQYKWQDHPYYPHERKNV